MKKLALIVLFAIGTYFLPAQDATSLNLKEVSSGKFVAVKNVVNQKGAFIIFIDNTCPFVESYNERLKEFSREQSSEGYSVLFVNPHENNNPDTDNMSAMKNFFKAKNWAGSYYSDPDHQLANALGATKLPELFFVQLSGNQLKVLYQGAIDNNPQDASEATVNYAKSAVNAFEKGAKIQPPKTPAMGCRIKRF